MDEKEFRAPIDLKSISKNIDSFIAIKSLNIKKTSLYRYYYNIRKFFRFAGIDIVSEENFRNYMIHVKGEVSAGQYNHILITLKQYTKYLFTNKLIPDCSFIDNYKSSQVRTKITKKYYKKEEIESFLQEVLHSKFPRWLYWYIWFGFQYGIRPKEIAMLEITDINIDDWIIHLRAEITKTNTESWIVIPSMHKNKIRKLLSWRALQKVESKRLFVNAWGEPITENSLANHRKSLRKIDPEFTFYHMRYTAGWRAYQKTGDIYFAAQLLRHKNINQTRDYLQIQKHETLKNMREKMELIY